MLLYWIWTSFNARSSYTVVNDEIRYTRCATHTPGNGLNHIYPLWFDLQELVCSSVRWISQAGIFLWSWIFIWLQAIIILISVNSDDVLPPCKCSTKKTQWRIKSSYKCVLTLNTIKDFIYHKKYIGNNKEIIHKSSQTYIWLELYVI